MKKTLLLQEDVSFQIVAFIQLKGKWIRDLRNNIKKKLKSKI